ncbi:MAG: PEP-CTERM sorting domain-containing protein [Akkermansia sp.]
MKTLLYTLSIISCLGMISSASAATVWNIDFNGAGWDNLPTSGTEKGTWNNVSLSGHGSSGITLTGDTTNIKTSTGAESQLGLSISQSGTGGIGPGDGVVLPETGGNSDYVPQSVKDSAPASAWRDSIYISNGATLTMTIKGLDPGEYSLSGFCGLNSARGKGTMTLNGETQHLNSWTDSGTPGTIIDFKAISVGADGTLTFSVQGTDQNCVALNYLTLTQKDKSVPEPSTVLLSVVALGGLLLRRRRNK